MGHASMWAALIYQHATADRDAAIAAALSRLANGQDVDAATEGRPGPPCTPTDGHVRVLRARSGHAGIIRRAGDRCDFRKTAADLRLL